MTRRAGTFWRLSALIVGGNFVLIGLLLVWNWQRDVLPISVSPADRAGEVSTRPTIRITYPRPVQPESLLSALRIEPPVEGKMEVNAAVLTLVPTAALRPATTYTVTIEAGVAEAVGAKVSRQPVRVEFRTRSPRLVVARRDDAGAVRARSVDPATGREWDITGGEGSAWPIAASPDGKRLAYVRFDGEVRGELWSAGLDGADKRMLMATGDRTISGMAWSPGDELLAYASRDIRGRMFGQPSGFSSSRIWLTGFDRQAPALVYGRGIEIGSTPVWAPDGKKLAFYDPGLGAIAVFDFSRTVTLIPSKGGAPGSWSPDGTRLAYVARADVSAERSTVNVARVRETGSGRSVTSDGFSDADPAWSPSADWIALVRRGTDGRSGIWLVRPDGGEARPIAPSDSSSYAAPVWSPDGAAVAYTRQPPGAMAGQNEEVWIARLDGDARAFATTGTVLAWVP